MEKIPDNETFLSMVAAIFEENMLIQVERVKDIDIGLMISINYCLDKFFGDKKNS